MAERDVRGLRFGGLLFLLTAAGVALVRTRSPLEGSLFDATLGTGWGLFVLLAALCACTWTPRRSLGALGLQLKWVALLTSFAAVAFAAHVESLPPTGTLDRLLGLGFALLAASSAWGFVLSLRLRTRVSAGDKRSFQRWLYLQATVLGLLLGAGAVHGFLVHTHGMMAGALAG